MFPFQKTRIGMSVNGLRKASSKEDLQGLARALIKNWKKLLGKYVFVFQGYLTDNLGMPCMIILFSIIPRNMSTIKFSITGIS